MLQLINKRQTNKFRTVAKGGLVLVAVLCFFVCLFSFNFAQSQSLDTGLAYAEQTGLPTTDIRLIIANIIRVALGLLGIIAVVIIIYGGWLWMSAGGNEDQIAKAKKTLLNGAVGLIIILSAYSIVLLVMRLLGISDGGSGEQQYNYEQQGIMNMAGSGAWGKVITDHYPAPNQVDVPRNTKIAITFAKPIKFDSVATKISQEQTPEVFDLKDNIIKIDAVLPSSTALGGYEFVTYAGGSRIYKFPITTTTAAGETREEIFTIVIEPKTLLGSPDDNIRYRVWIENSLQTEDGKSIFANTRIKYYQWFFTCSTREDSTPPRVVDIFPGRGETVAKNASIQITFSEAVFPNAQASFRTSTDGTYYEDKTNGNNPIVFIKSNSSTVPLGTFKITNQYRTLEFSSSLECGINACGSKIFCLPVCDKSNCANDVYQIVFKTAPTTTDASKPPFTANLSAGNGIMDMAGNSLDGNADNIYQFNPNGPFTVGLFNPDNYGWNFRVTKEMDITSPYVTYLSLGPETEKVTANENFIISWSKRMSYKTLYSIGIEEYPDPEERCNILARPPYNIPRIRCSADTLGKSPSSTSVFSPGLGVTTTLTQILHTAFLDGFPQYYIPEITSAVEDVFGNCYYPGKGPKNEERNVSCDSAGNCCSGQYCCNGDDFNNPFGGTYSATCTRDLILDYPLTD